MTSRLILALLALLALAGCRTPTAPPAVTPAPTQVIPGPTLFRREWRDLEPYLAGLADSQARALTALPDATVYYLELNLAEDLAVVDGTVEILYTNAETVELDRVALHLYPNVLGGEMTIGSASVNGTPIEPSFGEGEAWMAVPMAPALAVGARAVLRIEFSVRVPPTAQLNYGVLAIASGVLAYAHGYPMIAAYDDQGWNVGIPPTYGDLTYADAALYLVRVRAPEGVVLCASGIEIEPGEAGDRPGATFAVGPARDFYLAASRDFTVHTRQAGPTLVRLCSKPGSDAAAGEVLDVAQASLEVFGRRFAPYPYTELDIITTPTYALGIEYPGAFALNERLLTPEADFGSTPEAVLRESTVVHETAHEWFYNLVGNDQLHDPWLDEALAQFATLQYYRDVHGAGSAEGILGSFDSRWERVGREDIPVGLPVQDYDEREYGSIVYGRGPLFLVALEQTMGTDALESFLREYTTTFRWKVATTEGFKALAEGRCGCDLTPLFQAWVYPK